MSPPTDERRPGRGSGTFVKAADPNDNTISVAETAQLRRRRAASWRCPPLPNGSRDPLGHADGRRTPCNYSLTRAELLEEVERCRAAGWAGWELGERFVDPRTVAA
jgi:hypothetical protein